MNAVQRAYGLTDEEMTFMRDYAAKARLDTIKWLRDHGYNLVGEIHDSIIAERTDK